jgi:hypothetical protein
MGLDHSLAAVRITFTGIFAFCINEKGQCEIGVLKHPEHEATLSIARFGESNAPENIPPPAAWQSGLQIETENPGVRQYIGADFDRRWNTGDPEDFRWILDLEGPDLHDQHLERRTDGSGIVSLSPILRIDGGTIYTFLKTVNSYGRVSVQNKGPQHFLGKVARVIGIDIPCALNGKVVLRDRKNNQAPLLNTVSDMRYEITVNNTHTRPNLAPMGSGSDFLLFYELFAPPGEEFDLVVADGPNRAFSPPPLLCDGVFFGRSSSLA